MNKAWQQMTPITLTGTAAGPMTELERRRYLAGRDAAQRGDSPEAQRSPRPSRSSD